MGAEGLQPEQGEHQQHPQQENVMPTPSAPTMEALEQAQQVSQQPQAAPACLPAPVGEVPNQQPSAMAGGYPDQGHATGLPQSAYLTQPPSGVPSHTQCAPAPAMYPNITNNTYPQAGHPATHYQNPPQSYPHHGQLPGYPPQGIPTGQWGTGMTPEPFRGGYSSPSQVVSLDNDYLQRSNQPVINPITAGNPPPAQSNPYTGQPQQYGNPYPAAVNPTSVAQPPANSYPAAGNPMGVSQPSQPNYPNAGNPTHQANAYPAAAIPTAVAPQGVPSGNKYPTAGNPTAAPTTAPVAAPTTAPASGQNKKGLVCRIVSNSMTGSAIQLSSGGQYRTALMIYQMKLADVDQIFGEVHQHWNKEYSAAKTIFDSGIKGKAVRLAIRTQHKVLFSAAVSAEKIPIRCARDFFHIINEGLSNGQVIFFTYVIRDDGTWNFCHTGSSFLQDFASKHAFHSSASKTVRYAGEFHIHYDGATPVLVMDNNSGTYAPAVDNLKLVVSLIRNNIPDLRVDGWGREDPRLLRAIESSPTRMSVQQLQQQQKQKPGQQPPQSDNREQPLGV